MVVWGALLPKNQERRHLRRLQTGSFQEIDCIDQCQYRRPGCREIINEAIRVAPCEQLPATGSFMGLLIGFCLPLVLGLI